MGFKLTDSYMELGNLKYFRMNANLLKPGTFGEKRDPAGSKSWIDPHGDVKAEYLAGCVKGTGVEAIDWSQTNKSDFGVNLSLTFFGLNGKVSASGTFETVKSAKLKLASFSIAENPLKDMLNNKAGTALKDLADEGDNGRIVSQCWVGMEVELADHFASYGQGSASAKAAGSELQISATGGKYGTQTITISPGTTFAYASSKVTNWKNSKTWIDDMKVDYHS